MRFNCRLERTLPIGLLIAVCTIGCSPYGYGTTPFREARRAHSALHAYPIGIYSGHYFESADVAQPGPPEEVPTPSSSQDSSSREPPPVRIQPASFLKPLTSPIANGESIEFTRATNFRTRSLDRIPPVR